jgi:hypothetical protein
VTVGGISVTVDARVWVGEATVGLLPGWHETSRQEKIIIRENNFRRGKREMFFMGGRKKGRCFGSTSHG